MFTQLLGGKNYLGFYEDLLKKKRLIIESSLVSTYKGHMIQIRDVASVVSLLV